MPVEAVMVTTALPLEASGSSHDRRVGLKSVLPVVVKLMIKIA